MLCCALVAVYAPLSCGAGAVRRLGKQWRQMTASIGRLR